MATVRELVVKFGFEVDDEPLRRMEQGISDIKTALFAVGTAAAAGAAALFGLAKTTAAYGERTHNLAQSVGITTESLQRLTHAANLNGASAEILGVSLRQISRAAFMAKTGSKEATEAFGALGVSVMDSSGNLKTADRLMLEVSDKFAKMPQGTNKSALAMRLFGESGTRMIRMLNQGSAAIQGLGDEAAAFGAIMDDKAIEQSLAFNDEITRLTETVFGLGRSIGMGLIPPITEIVTEIRKWMLANRDLLKTRIQQFIEVTTKFLSWFLRVAKSVWLVLKAMIETTDRLTKSLGGIVGVLKGLAAVAGLFILGKLGMALAAVVKGFLLIGKAALFAWKRALLGPILIGAAIAAAFLIVEDFLAFIDGRPSVLGFLVRNKEKIFQAVVDWLGKVKRRIMDMLGLTETEFDSWFTGITAGLGAVTAYFVGKVVGPWVAGFAKVAFGAASMAARFAIASGSIIASAVKASVSMVAAAGKTAIAWSAAAGRGVLAASRWVGSISDVAASARAGAAAMLEAGKRAAMYAAAQIKAGVLASGAWLKAAASAVKSAVISGAAWTKQAALWVAANVKMAAAAIASAVKASAAWVASMAKIAIATLAMSAKAAAAWVVALAPILAVIAAIAAVGFAVVQVVKYWDDITATFGALWNAFLQGLNNVWVEIKLGSKAAWDSVVAAGAAALDLLKSAWSGLVAWFGGLWDSVASMAADAGARLRDGLIQPIVEGFTSMFGWLKGTLGSLAAKVGLDFETPTLPKAVAPAVAAAGLAMAAPMSAAAASPTVMADRMSAQAEAGTSSRSVSNQFDATINVTVPPGSDANAVGEAVRRAAREEFDRMVRPAARATEGNISY
jgi:hypothetical protein